MKYMFKNTSESEMNLQRYILLLITQVYSV